MKANLTTLKFGIVALIAIAGTAGAVACSSDDTSNNGPTIPANDASASSSGGSSSGGSSGSSGGSSGSSGGSSGSSGSSSGALCVDSGTDPSNACSPFGCAGFYDNAMHGVPNPVPSP